MVTPSAISTWMWSSSTAVSRPKMPEVSITSSPTFNELCMRRSSFCRREAGRMMSSQNSSAMPTMGNKETSCSGTTEPLEQNVGVATSNGSTDGEV